MKNYLRPRLADVASGFRMRLPLKNEAAPKFRTPKPIALQCRRLAKRSISFLAPAPGNSTRRARKLNLEFRMLESTNALIDALIAVMREVNRCDSLVAAERLLAEEESPATT